MADTRWQRIADPRVLLGCSIDAVIPQEDGGWVLIVSRTVKNRGEATPHVFHVEPWRDEEGNGPGHLYIEQSMIERKAR